MKRRLPSFEKLICCLLLTFFVLHVTAQQTTKINAKELVTKYAVNIGLFADDLNNLRISDAYIDKLSGATIIYLQQTYKGIDIMNAVQTVVIKNNKLVSLAGKRIQKIEARVNIKSGIPSITPEDAVKVMARHLNLRSPASIRTVKSLDETKTVTNDDLGISSVPVVSGTITIQKITGTVVGLK
ncbi:hypothetical protein BH11BAC6_BH11BAC6_14250 [soil metagenome]